MAEFNEAENKARIEKLNEGMAKSSLPYHTDETEKIQAERAKSLHEAPAKPGEPAKPTESHVEVPKV